MRDQKCALKVQHPDCWVAAALPRPLVFTNGVFDLLHRGHTSYLAEARGLGASLLVAINSNASTQRLGKGEGRPVNSLEDRMAVIAALDAVDAVTWFDEDTPAALIERLKPEVIAKGGDWLVERVVGAQETLARGGSIRMLSYLRGYSTSSLIERIKNLP